MQEGSDLVNKGTDLYFEGKKDEAIKAYDEAVKIDPSMAGAYYSKGVAYCSLGKANAANAAFDKAKILIHSYTEVITARFTAKEQGYKG